MRLLSLVLTCSRWIIPLPNDSGRLLGARGVEFRRRVKCLSYVHCGDVLNRSGAAATLAAVEEIVAPTENRSWIQSALNSGSLLNLTTLKSHASRRQASKLGGEGAEPPLSENSTSDLRFPDSGKHTGNLTGSMSEEECEEGSTAGELRNRPNTPVVPYSRKNLEVKVDSCLRSGNEGGEHRGLSDQGQVDNPPESGLNDTASFSEADRITSPSRFGRRSFENVSKSNSKSPELGDDLHIDDPLAQFAYQNCQVHGVADASGASLQAKESKLPVVLAVSSPPNGEVESVTKYPVPLTPFSGEVERAIEYERAMVAEAAMKSAPAIYRSDILFEDEWLMVINKPCGIYSEHVLATVPSLLQASAPFLSDSSPKDANVIRGETHLHLANRLDRDTSGLMVVTKCIKAAGMMSKIFTTRWVQKTYLALCAAPLPRWEHLTIESGHGRSRFGAWRVYATKDIGRKLPGKCVVRDMRTHFTVVAANKKLVTKQMNCGYIPTGRSWWEEVKAENSVLMAGEEHISDDLPSLLNVSKDTLPETSHVTRSLSDCGDEVIIRAFPFTGRTHQIRLHCQYIGIPLRGDVKYGGPHIWNGVQYDHHALHAETLSFRHPFTSENLFLVAPLPQWARDVGIQTHQA